MALRTPVPRVPKPSPLPPLPGLGSLAGSADAAEALEHGARPAAEGREIRRRCRPTSSIAFGAAAGFFEGIGVGGVDLFAHARGRGHQRVGIQFGRLHRRIAQVEVFDLGIGREVLHLRLEGRCVVLMRLDDHVHRHHNAREDDRVDRNAQRPRPSPRAGSTAWPLRPAGTDAGYWNLAT